MHKSIFHIIGSGNLAWHLCQLLKGPNLPKSVQVWGRTFASLDRIKADYPEIKCSVIEDSIIGQKDDVIFLAIKDTSISLLTKQLSSEATILHCSGAASSNLFQPHFPKSGAFWPIQTFTAGRPISTLDIPWAGNSMDVETLKYMQRLGAEIGNGFTILTDEERAQSHLACVFANNFLNHLLTISNQIGEQKKELLEPIMKETIQKFIELGGIQSQTGPAIRNDENTLAKHLQMLQKNPVWAQMYQIFTESIQHTAQN